jgi:Ca-activated chloride channel family protein
MRLRMRCCGLALLLILCRPVSSRLAGQEQQLPQTGTIRISANLVQVPVSVTDAAGHPVRDLQLEDFLLEENSRPVTLAYLGEPGETRLDMVLVFDNSGSVFPNFDFERQAATSFLKRIFRKGDSVSIVSIGSKPNVIVRPTESLEEALEGLAQLRASAGSTAFFDSIITAARLLRVTHDPDTRRVQVVLSDGEDNFSDQRLPDALREIQQADCLFYSINPTGQSIRLNRVSLRGQQGMETLAEQTGGAAFLADQVSSLPEIYDRIAAELQSQYLVNYYSPDARTDGGFRRIVVRLPKQPELRLRARQGYYSAKAVSK